jgi:hypothetical protein
MSTSPSSVVPWSQVLENLEAAVSLAVAEAADRARRLQQAADAATPPPKPAAWEEALAQSRQRCQGLATTAAAAASKVAEVDKGLEEGEKALKDWLQETGNAREKLANWVGRAVG